jgi:hypothetical protein
MIAYFVKDNNMNELIIERLEHLKAHNVYLADCQVIEGHILQNDIFSLKSNPEIKITFKSPAIIKSDQIDKLVYYTIFKPDFDLDLFNNPTFWIKQ